MSAPGVNQAVNAGMAVFADAMKFAAREGATAQDKATLGTREISQYKMSLVSRGMSGDVQEAAVSLLERVAGWSSVGTIDKNDEANIRARLQGSVDSVAGHDGRFAARDLQGASAGAAAARLAAAMNSDSAAARAMGYQR